MDNAQGYERLAAAVKERRDRRGWTQLDVAARGGLSIDRIQAIEGARSDRYSSQTFAKLERGLEWESGSSRAILAGGDPTPRETQTSPAPVPPSIEEMFARLLALETEVAELRARETRNQA